MQHVNDFLVLYLGGSALLWDIALGVLFAKLIATIFETIFQVIFAFWR